MKIRRLVSILLIAMFIVSSLVVNVSAADKLSANVKKGTITVDGVADELWNNVDAIEIGRIKNSGDSPNDGTGNTGSFKLMYDDSNLYVIVFVNDKTRFNSGTGADHQQDSVEIFVDPLNTVTDSYDDDDFRFCITADGLFSMSGAMTDANVTYKAVDGADSFVIEMAIAIKDACASFNFAAGTAFGWDIQLNDCDTGATARNHCKGWNDDANEAWQNATYMGTLNLTADEAAPAVVEEVAAVEAPAAEVAAPVAEAAAPAPVVAAQTGDATIAFVAIMVLAAVAFVVTKKVRS
jgi:Domain of unknown function (DUF1083).